MRHLRMEALTVIEETMGPESPAHLRLRAAQNIISATRDIREGIGSANPQAILETKLLERIG